MKTNMNAFLQRNDSLLSLILWMAMASVIFSFAQKAQGAVISVTSISSAPTLNSSNLYVRAEGRVGDSSASTNEFTLTGTTSVAENHRFVNQGGPIDHTTSSLVSISLTGVLKTFTLNPISPSGIPTTSSGVSPINTSAPNTVYVWANSSGTAEGNLLKMLNLTLAIDGNSHNVGDVVVGDTQPDFAGLKIEFTGDLQQILWNQEFFKPSGNFNSAFGSQQEFHVAVVVPEPSMPMLLIASSLLFFRRNR
jgi:hypothetical protein